MAKLTRTRISQIRAVLDASFFTSTGFTVETGTAEQLIVSVKLIDNAKYCISLGYEKKTVGGLGFLGRSSLETMLAEPPMIMVVRQSPGDFLESESSEVKDFKEFLEVLKRWTDRLKGEVLFIDALEKKMAAFQSQLNKRLDEHCADPKSHFSEAERESLMGMLRDLQEKITKLEDSDESLKTEMKEMKQALSDLANASITMAKRSWFRTACSKLYEISTRAMASKPGQKLLEGAIDKLLEAPKGG